MTVNWARLRTMSDEIRAALLFAFIVFMALAGCLLSSSDDDITDLSP